MFERGDVLRTWALQELPQDWAPIVTCTKRLASVCREAAGANQVNAEQLPDHRRDYLEYEGPVSGGRGEVSRIEEGTYEVQRESADEWQVQIIGRLLRGQITFVRQAPNGRDWRLTFQAASSAA